MTEKLVILKATFICPSCGRDAAVYDDDDGHPVLLHKMPQCERFRRVNSPQDWIDYLAEARTAKQNYYIVYGVL